MNKCKSELSPDELLAKETRLKSITAFWNDLQTCDHSGATTWEVLRSLENEVTECLYRNPPDVVCAESLTAQAALLISGCTDL